MKQEKTDALIAWLVNTGGYVSAEELAALLHVTTRTVRNYVSQINRSASGEPLILSSKSGYCWSLTDNAPFGHSSRTQTENLTPQERITYLLRQLLFREVVRYDVLADRLLVGAYTLDEDLNKVRQVLRPFRLHIHRKGDSLRLSGPQIPRRQLIIDTIYRTGNITTLSETLLQTIFPLVPMREFIDLLQELLPKYGLSAPGAKLYELVLLITLQLQQIQVGNVIRDEPGLSLAGFGNFPDCSCAQELANRLELRYNLYYTSSERAYLTLLLIAMAEDSAAVPAALPNPRMREAAELLVSKIGKYLHTDLTQGGFLHWLGLYLQRMVVRQSLHLSRPCQLRSKMRSTHPTLYGLTADFLFTFSGMLGTPIRSDEICWLCLILASYIRDDYVFEAPVSCSLMLPVAPPLADQIRSTLTARIGTLLNVRQTLLLADEDQLLPDTQLVLSLIPIQGRAHCLQISPFPKSLDIRRIYDTVLKIKMEGYVLRLKAYLERYMAEDTFLHTAELKSQRSVIQRVCGQLTKAGIVSEDYARNLLEMENFESSGFDNLVAVPFAAHESVTQSRIFVVTTENHIPWKTGKINLFFFLVCRDSDDPDFRDLYDLLIKIFCRPKNVQAVSGSRSIPEFLEGLDRILSASK